MTPAAQGTPGIFGVGAPAADHRELAAAGPQSQAGAWESGEEWTETLRLAAFLRLHHAVEPDCVGWLPLASYGHSAARVRVPGQGDDLARPTSKVAKRPPLPARR